MMQLMQNEIDRSSKDSEMPPLDYEELFKLFIVKRKIKLLRFLFGHEKNLLEFDAELFLMALELDAYDMAALLFKEFFRLLRNLDA